MTIDVIENLEHRRRQAMLAADITTLDQLLEPECIYVHTNGVRETKAVYIDKVRTGQYRYLSLTSSDNSITVVSEFAFALGVTTLKVVRPDGSQKTVQSRSIAVWTKRTGIWQLLHYQGTAVPS